MSDIKEHQAVLLELLKEFDRICKKRNIPYMLFAGSMLGAVRHNGFIPWDDDLDVVMMRTDYEKFLSVANELIDKERYYLQVEFSEHWPLYFSKLRKNNTTCLEKYHPKDKQMHQGIYIDIFPCDNASDYEWIRKLQYIASRVILTKAFDKRGYDTDSNIKRLLCKVGRCFPALPFYKFSLLKRCTKSMHVHTFYGGTSKYKKGVFPRQWFEKLIEVQFEDMKVPISKEYDKILTKMYGDYMEIPSEEERQCKIHAILVDTENSYTKYLEYQNNIKFDGFTKSIR